MSRRIVGVLTLVFVGLGLHLAMASSEVLWSAPVEGVQARLRFDVAPKDHDLVMVHTILELRNVSDVANPIYLTYDPLKSLKVTVHDGTGAAVSTGANPADVLSVSAYLVALPHAGTLSFDVTAYGYAVPRGTPALLGLDCGSWNLHPGRYAVAGVFRSGAPEAGESRRLWDRKLQLPSTPLLL